MTFIDLLSVYWILHWIIVGQCLGLNYWPNTYFCKRAHTKLRKKDGFWNLSTALEVNDICQSQKSLCISIA